MASYMSSEAVACGTSFQKEISEMMHGFGDNPKPLTDTVILVESIVLRQLRQLLQEAHQISLERGNECISNYEVIYLIKNNILKMKKLEQYQVTLNQIEQKYQKIGLADFLNEKGLPGVGRPKTKRTHIQIINDLDEKNEVKLITFDAIRHLRNMRDLKLSEKMGPESYQAFHEAKRSSFCTSSSLKKLEQWINPDKELKVTTMALEVLGFIAHETVGEIVDAVYLIRNEAKKPNNPYRNPEGGFICNPIALNTLGCTDAGSEGNPPITVEEVNAAIKKYFTPRIGLNELFYNNMGIELPVTFVAF